MSKVLDDGFLSFRDEFPTSVAEFGGEFFVGELSQGFGLVGVVGLAFEIGLVCEDALAEGLSDEFGLRGGVASCSKFVGMVGNSEVGRYGNDISPSGVGVEFLVDEAAD